MPRARFADALRAAREGRDEHARELCRQLLQQDPAHVQALQLAAMLAARAGDPQAALQAMDRALALQPDDAALHCNRANVLDALGRADEALAACNEALRLAPTLAAAHFNRARLLQAQDRWADAAAAFAAAAINDIGLADLHADEGAAWLQAGRPDAALAAFDRVLARQPRLASAWSNRSAALRALGRLDDALASSERALALQPDDVAAIVNRGAALQDLGRGDEATAAFERAVALQPLNADAQWNLALALLRQGEFTRGFALYEWRFERGRAGVARRHTSLPRWGDGAPLHGRRLLVHAEQGLGDTIQFARFASVLAARGVQVLLEVQRPLQRLLATLDGVAQCIAIGDAPPDVDAAVPLMSLAHQLGITLHELPAADGYLRADPALAQAWRQRLGPAGRPRIGLQWRSGSVSRIRGRSLALAQLAPLLHPGCEWISLHKDLDDEDRATLAGLPQLRHFGDQQQDMADAAALCTAVDLVISVDTSIAHLAGALARPTWVLLPAVADWRWLQGRDDSPWYRSLRLFRQTAAGDWVGVLARVAAELRRRYAG